MGEKAAGWGSREWIVDVADSKHLRCHGTRKKKRNAAKGRNERFVSIIQSTSLNSQR